MKEFILENWKTGLWILFASGFVFEITPIKIKPLSFILSGIGKRLNKDVKEDINKVQKDVEVVRTDVEVVRKDLQSHTIDGQRRDILNFSNKLMVNGYRTKEDFDYIISLYDSYENYLERNNLENGKVDLAMEYIKKKYKECMDNNSFYTGK